MKVREKDKRKAITLRRQGLSYTQIGAKLGVGKSTLSSWLKDVPLADKHRQRLYTARIKSLTYGPRSSKARRQKEVAEILEHARREMPGRLSRDELRLFGAALYWAEGTKKGRLEITNSDPLLIVLMIDWITEMFGVPAKSLSGKLNVYAQQDENELRRFWADVTGIPLANFKKSYVKPASKNYKKNNLYYGTIKITVPKSTDMKYRTFGWIEGIVSPYEKKVRTVQRKWRHLERVERPINVV